MEGVEVRIQRVVLSLPAMCQLTGQLEKGTGVPDLKELSKVSMFELDEDWDGEMRRFDVTRNITRMSTQNDKTSPFVVLALCSRDTDESPEEKQFEHRPSNHQHGSSLKMITREIKKPTLEQKKYRRVRRAAPNEPSTLRSFTHKRESGRGRECANTRHGKTCCRRSLKIKFQDLGISDVILEPKEFDAHVCDGRCNARRVSYASTHAMFQHILHQTKGKQFAPRPCCVPTALTELDVLHLDPNGNRNGGPKLIVTILKDAIVKECGCS